MAAHRHAVGRSARPSGRPVEIGDVGTIDEDQLSVAVDLEGAQLRPQVIGKNYYSIETGARATESRCAVHAGAHMSVPERYGPGIRARSAPRRRRRAILTRILCRTWRSGRKWLRGARARGLLVYGHEHVRRQIFSGELRVGTRLAKEPR
jgi:hypothetical protein